MACLAYKFWFTQNPKLNKKKSTQTNEKNVDRIFLKYRRRKELFKLKDNIGKVNTLLSNLGWKKVIH